MVVPITVAQSLEGSLPSSQSAMICRCRRAEILRLGMETGRTNAELAHQVGERQLA